MYYYYLYNVTMTWKVFENDRFAESEKKNGSVLKDTLLYLPTVVVYIFLLYIILEIIIPMSGNKTETKIVAFPSIFEFTL